MYKQNYARKYRANICLKSKIIGLFHALVCKPYAISISSLPCKNWLLKYLKT